MKLTDKPLLLSIVSWTVIHLSAPPKAKTAEAGFYVKQVKLTDKPGSVWTVIHLGQQSLTGSSSLPGLVRAVPYEPLFGLAPGGVYRARTVTSRAVRSYRTLSPLPDPLARAIGGLLSVALVVGFPPGVTWHPALWSPDFPPLRPSPRRGRRRSGDCLVSFGAQYRGLRALVTPRCAFQSPVSRRYT